MTILCLASYEKGYDFLRSAKREGARVLLLTSLSLKDKAQWPRDSIDEIFYMPDDEGAWNRDHVVRAVSHLARAEKIERIVPLDDFDLEIAATLREHLRLPGLGESATRAFRDKLAMRTRARESGILVPEFSGIFNDAQTSEFLQGAQGPWMLKPRSLAGAIGIRRINSAHEFWDIANELGDQRSFYLLERFVPGDVFHVDSIVYDGEIQFDVASSYGRPPMDVSHEGGVFTTQVMKRGEEAEQSLRAANRRLLSAFGLHRGVSHTEFIRAHEDGRIYFLETSARVGGANIADMIEAATGVNLWAEWARVELASADSGYALPDTWSAYAGLLVSLSREEWPDTSGFAEPEIVWRMTKRHHVGLIVRSPDFERITSLLHDLAGRINTGFSATMPARMRPTE